MKYGSLFGHIQLYFVDLTFENDIDTTQLVMTLDAILLSKNSALLNTILSTQFHWTRKFGIHLTLQCYFRV